MSRFSEAYPHKLSTTVLSQFAGVRSHPYTGYVVLRLCENFKISVRGQRNINSAFNNLPVYFSPDERLTFGWAPVNLIRNREVHEGAYEHLALMITLSETFHDAYASRVLYEMAQATADPEDVTPHFHQWRSLVHCCNGAFATVDFGLLVENYLRLDPFNIIADSTIRAGRWPVEPKSMATALMALRDCTNGQEKQLTFIGSAIIAWFAAVSEWLFDLRIAIFSNDGKELHVSHPGQGTQVLLIFTEKAGIQVSRKEWTKDHAQVSASVATEQSYASSIHTTPFGGRVVWQSLLPRVFGRSFHHLDHDESKTFGMFIGSAARMFQTLALGEGKEVHTDLISSQNRANPASYGPGLVQTLTNWLPELRRFQGRMERALKVTADEAGPAYVEHLTRLRNVCHCGICSTNSTADSTSEAKPPEHGYCLTVLAETIMAIGLALSRITVAAQLYPTRGGIQSFYAGQVAKRLEARGLHWTKHFTLVYGNEWNAPNERRLQNCVQIFSGSQPQDYLPKNLVAISHEGICAYFVDLEKSGASRMDEPVKLIRVVSGGINVRHKVFYRACFGPVEDEEQSDPWEEVACHHLPKPLYCR